MICKYEHVTKRSGAIADFNHLKIVDAIMSAMREVYKNPLRKKAKSLCDKVLIKLNNYDAKELTVQDIHYFVEQVLNEASEFEVAKQYIIYTHDKDKKDDKALIDSRKLIEDYISASDWRVRENANAGYSFPSMINHISNTTIAAYTLSSVYPDRIAKGHINGDYHIHDLGLGIIPYCSGWSLRDLLLKGFIGCHGRASAKPAKHFDTALLQVVNFLSTLQTEFSGAQALNDFDVLLAPYVRKDGLTYKQVKQALQQMVFGLNIGSRLGQCIPEGDQILSVDKGWVSSDNIEVGDQIYVFDIKTKKLKIDVVKHITRREEHNKLHKYSNNTGFESLVTSGHRVIYKIDNTDLTISESENILNKYSDVDIPVSAEVDSGDLDIENEFLVSLIDMCCRGCLALTDDKSIRSVYDSLKMYNPKKMLGEDPFLASCAYLDSMKHLNGIKQIIPDFFMKLSARQSRLVISNWVKFESLSTDYSFTLRCDSSEIQDCLQEIAVRAGYATRKYESIDEEGLPIKGLVVLINSYEACTIEEVPYNGCVWCVTTDTGTIVARHNGSTYITGNCAFTNISFALSVPDDMRDEPIIHAGDYIYEETYADYQKEMDIINIAFMEVMYEGDASGSIFSFPIPTYNLTNTFDWDSNVSKMLFKMTAKYGIPYFQNFISSDLDPTSVRSMCCRLQLDMNQIHDRTGGLYGAGDKVGSIGVCTINLPRLGYLAKDEDDYFKRLSDLMELAKDSLETKRDYIIQNYKRGLLPYTEKYLDSFNTYFSTIGLVGMNESCLNLFGKDLTTKEGVSFALKVMYYMRDKIIEFQKETGNLYNLEATPAEGTSYRLAKIDKVKYPDIITSGTKDNPYYTNSIQLPVSFTDDVFTALDLQEELQRTFTGGTVFHTFIGEELTPEQTKNLVRAIATNYSIPYFSITPTFSICPEHGYIAGLHEKCPHCNK